LFLDEKGTKKKLLGRSHSEAHESTKTIRKMHKRKSSVKLKGWAKFGGNMNFL
jgi:hypothetical protein